MAAEKGQEPDLSWQLRDLLRASGLDQVAKQESTATMLSALVIANALNNVAASIRAVAESNKTTAVAIHDRGVDLVNAVKQLAESNLAVAKANNRIVEQV